MKRYLNSGVGERVAEFRNARGISQKWLAKRINCSVGLIQSYEHGRTRITVERLEALAEALGCDAVDLLRPKGPAK